MSAPFSGLSRFQTLFFFFVVAEGMSRSDHISDGQLKEAMRCWALVGQGHCPAN